MNIQMPRRKREFVGVTAIVLGGILAICGGTGLGRKVEFWGGYYADKLESIPKSFTKETKNTDYKIRYSMEGLEEEKEYIKKRGYMAVGGLALIIGGAFIAGIKRSLPPLSKSINYGKSLLTYGRRGTRKHPYRL